MTRFARAKGSKSSNERVPDEATPWNVMKMQLKSSTAASTSVTKRAKNAKELLAEKNEPFYMETTGNVNHEWAAFDNVPANRSKENEKNKKLVTNKSVKNDTKEVKNDSRVNNDETTEDSLELTNDRTSSNELESREKKTNITLNEGEMEKTVEGKNLLKRNNVDEVENSDSKSKKCRKKSKKLKSDAKNDSTAELEEAKEDVKHSDAGILDNKKSKIPVESEKKENSEKLSKRQKRNQKKQRKIMSEKSESLDKETENENLCKEENLKSFDVEGNNWSSEVKFGRQVNHRQAVTDDRISEAEDRLERNNDRGNVEKKNKKNKDGSKACGECNESHNETTAQLEVPNDLKETETNGKKNQKRKGGKNEKKEYKRRKPDEGAVKMIINGNEILVVKYDGFPVKKEDADRLQELKKTMIIKGIPRSEINIAMKLERRKAEKALARERKRVCFHCRKSGHNLSDCPALERDEAGTGICFKCGSAEHTHFECKVVKAQEFRHANCFICREQGHIARQCPDNPKGLYPQGGSCKICGDVTHLKKDCPDLIKEKEETNITADKITGDQLEALHEDDVVTKTGNYDNKTKSKIIKF